MEENGFMEFLNWKLNGRNWTIFYLPVDVSVLYSRAIIGGKCRFVILVGISISRPYICAF